MPPDLPCGFATRCKLRTYVRIVQTSPEKVITLDEPVCRRHVGMLIDSAIGLRGKVEVKAL